MQVPPFSLSKQLLDLGSDLDSAVLRVLHSGQFIGGEEVKAFEDSFAKFIGVPYVVGCNSGTDALILALRALDIGPGDEVITTAFSFFATAEAISAVGALPVFVDVDPNNYLIDLRSIEASITSSTKAILPVHLFGCPVDMQKLMQIARKYQLKVVEDCAQATGAEWGGLPVGSWGDVGCFSFFPTKNLGAAGDAGAITTKDLGIAQRIRELAVHGMPRRYLHSDLGYNSRLDAIQAAILNVKLPNLYKWVKRREMISKRYTELLKDIPEIEVPSFKSSFESKHGWNQFVIRVNCKKQKEHALNANRSISLSTQNARDVLKKSLEDLGVNTIIYYPIPIHHQPAYSTSSCSDVQLFITEQLCKEVLSLPMFPEITEEEQMHVIDSIKQIFNRSTHSEIEVFL